MRNFLVELWTDECGALIGTEWVYAVTIIVLGSVTGLLMMRNAAIRDLAEVGQAVQCGGQSNYESHATDRDFGAAEEMDGGF